MSRLVLPGIQSQRFFMPITQTQAYITAVEADGGTIGDPQKLDLLFRFLVNHSLLGNVVYFYSKFGGYKQSAGTITKLYDLGSGNRHQTVFTAAPSINTIGFNGGAGSYWTSPTSERSINDWTNGLWGLPNDGISFMGVGGDDTSHEANYINTSTNSMYHIDSNNDFNSMGGGGVDFSNGWHSFIWKGSDSANEVHGFVDGSLVGTLTSTELGGTADGRFRDHLVLTYNNSSNAWKGLFNDLFLMDIRLSNAQATELYNVNKSVYGHG